VRFWYKYNGKSSKVNAYPPQEAMFARKKSVNIQPYKSFM